MLEHYKLNINNSYHFATARVAGCDSPQAGLWEHEIFVKHTPTNFLLAEFDNAAITKDVTTCEEKTVRTLHDFQVLKGINRGESVVYAVDRPDPWGYGFACARRFGSLVPRELVHCRTSPRISPLSPVPTAKTPAPPTSQPKGLLVHCRTSPCISPLSPVPTAKPPAPPSSQPKGLLVHCRTSPCISPLSPVPTKTPVPPSSQPKGLLVPGPHR